MNNPNIIPYHIEKNMPVDDRKKYYQKLRNLCYEQSKNKSKVFSIGQKGISKLYLPEFYNKKLEIYGEENIPRKENIIFVCNHSNSHDIFSMYTILERINNPTSVMVATDCLNPATVEIFKFAGSTLFDRRNKKESNNSIFDMSSSILAGKSGTIFGEATWNLHPIKPMQSLKIGTPRIALISDSIVIPTILEYIEVPGKCKKEKDLYSKVIIYFGKPIEINFEESLEYQALKIEREMIEMRKNLWEKYGVSRRKISDVDPTIYVNHTYLKKYRAFGFEYDSQYESQFLRSQNDGLVENEYHISESGKFEPGLILKK